MGFTREKPFVTADGSPAMEILDADGIVFLAGSTTPSSAEHDPAAVAAELKIFERFIDCLSRLDKRPVVMVASSGGTVYDPAKSPPYAETTPTRPAAVYGRSKMHMEQRLLSVPAEAARAVVLRISNAYGPGQRLGSGQGVAVHWMAAAIRGEPLRVFGDLSAARDYIYVDDVIRAMMILLQSDPTVELPRVLNIGSGMPTTLDELVDLVARMVGGAEIKREPSRSFDVHHTWLNVRLAREAIGWAPSVPLDEGLRRTWDYVRTTLN